MGRTLGNPKSSFEWQSVDFVPFLRHQKKSKLVVSHIFCACEMALLMPKISKPPFQKKCSPKTCIPHLQAALTIESTFIYSVTKTEVCVPDHGSRTAIMAKFRAFMQNPDLFRTTF